MTPENIARALVDAYSPSGSELPALLLAERFLRHAGLQVERQEVGSPDRFNLFAAKGKPRVVLSTHLDTVPGELEVTVRDGRLYGRGACDAKGSAAAMIAAAADLIEAGHKDFGVLFVVGEETTSDGAMAANELVASGAIDWPVTDTLLAEPTQGKFVSAHPGLAVATLRSHGRCAHSAFPEEGHSAIHALLSSLERIRNGAWPEDTELGPTRINIGLIEGGTAANVVSAEASASLMLRSGGSSAEILSSLQQCASTDCELDIHCHAAPVRFSLPCPELEAEGTGPVPFGTDAPFLTALGRLYLCGPGSIRLAHSDDEFIPLEALAQARSLYSAWTRERLGVAPVVSS